VPSRDVPDIPMRNNYGDVYFISAEVGQNKDGKTNLNGARFGIPSRDKVDTKAMGRGIMAEVKILYESL
jgi:hypothetical protein